MRIVTYKTAFYSFYLPVAAGMALAGVAEGPAYDLAKKVGGCTGGWVGEWADG